MAFGIAGVANCELLSPYSRVMAHPGELQPPSSLVICCTPFLTYNVSPGFRFSADCEMVRQGALQEPVPVKSFPVVET